MSNSQYYFGKPESTPVDTRRTRSFDGCVTCRGRRMKCDETRPKCTMCRISGLPCGGYGKRIFFDFEEAPDSGPARFRRPLLTKEERESMSREITSSVPPTRAMWHIARIDEECESIPKSENLQLSRGPFGAFRIVPGSPSSMSTPGPGPTEPKGTPGPRLPDTSAHLEENYGHMDEALFVQPDASMPSPTKLRVEDVCDTSADPMDDWWSIDSWWSFTDLRSDPNWWENPSERSCEQDTPYKDSMLDLQQAFSSSLAPGNAVASAILPADAARNPICETTLMSLAPNYAVPDDAVLLLKHYSTTVLQSLTPYRHSKTPWHVLFIPHAKSCLAAITLGEEMDHTGLCAFFGMLSISASSLGVVSGSERWLAQSEACREQAQGHARLMLRTAYDVPKTAKYKSILIALLTMVQMSTVAGDREKTECYFLEAEKFIRVRGLNRRKSRKVRLLHHCYTFERILYETTFSGSAHSSLRCDVRRAIESCGANAFSQDCLSFKCPDWGNLEKEMRKVKDKEEGENDLHIQLPGIWSATLYPEIFGVPEIYVFLLSLVIRLGRSKDNATAHSSTVGLEEYMNRAKSVEQCIQHLRRRPECVSVVPTTYPERQHCQRLLEILVTAMQQALIIYFYRRVYDVDPSMLQANVLAVRDCLRSFEAGSCGVGYGEARLAWPAYIAASEAEDYEVREEIERWFDSCGRRSGLRTFSGSWTGIRGIRADKGGVERGAGVEIQA